METLHLGLVAIGGRHWMGGSNYLRNLAAAVQAAEPGTSLTWIVGEELLEDWSDVTPRWKVPRAPRFDRLLRRQPGRVRKLLGTTGVDFLFPLTHFSAPTLGLHFPVQRALGSCRWAGWVPDFQHRHLPDLFSATENAALRRQVGRMAAEAPCVVLSSENALADFRNFYPEHAAKGALLTFRVCPAIPPDDAELVAGDPERYFLVCNQFWKHKNHRVVFEALRLLRARGVAPLVLCTGAMSDYRGGEHLDELRKLVAEDGVRESVRLLGLVPQERVTALMRRAVAVIQPSLFEGWSTVVEDARVLGRPCLLSDLPVHREQAPPGARYFDPHAPHALADLMEEAWQSWPAGPDHTAEAAARTLAQEQHAEFGRQFLGLARTLLAER